MATVSAVSTVSMRMGMRRMLRMMPIRSWMMHMHTMHRPRMMSIPLLSPTTMSSMHSLLVVGQERSGRSTRVVHTELTGFLSPPPHSLLCRHIPIVGLLRKVVFRHFLSNPFFSFVRLPCRRLKQGEAVLKKRVWDRRVEKEERKRFKQKLRRRKKTARRRKNVKNSAAHAWSDPGFKFFQRMSWSVEDAWCFAYGLMRWVQSQGMDACIIIGDGKRESERRNENQGHAHGRRVIMI